MRAVLHADGRAESGGAPLVMHNERMVDPLDEYVRAISKISKKRNKTDADQLEIARLEFLGGLYMNGNGPCLPAWNMIRCLQDGATKQKRGKDVLRGVYPVDEHADVLYEGPRDPVEMWKSGEYSLRKGVVVNRGSRTMRTRPIFTDWQASLEVEVDPTIFDIHTLEAAWKHAGRYEGIAEMRPIYGRFNGTIEAKDEVSK